MDGEEERRRAKRGSVFLIEHQFIVGDHIRQKYAVLLEDFSPRRPTVWVAFTTSNTRFRDRPTAVAVEKGNMDCWDDISVIDLNNMWELGVDQVVGENSTYQGQLPREIIDQMNIAIEFVDCDMGTQIRIRP